MGPDREITVRVYESKLKEVQTSGQVDGELKCKLGVDVQVEGGADEWDITLSKEDGTVLKKERAKGKMEWEVDAELWWPVGEGLPTRYTVKVDLLDKVHPLNQVYKSTLIIGRYRDRYPNQENRFPASGVSPRPIRRAKGIIILFQNQQQEDLYGGK
jgi:hypothetical protein